MAGNERKWRKFFPPPFLGIPATKCPKKSEKVREKIFRPCLQSNPSFRFAPESITSRPQGHGCHLQSKMRQATQPENAAALAVLYRNSFMLHRNPPRPYTSRNDYESVSHRGLRRLIEEGNSRFLPQVSVGRLRNILLALALSENIGAFAQGALPGWRVHQLSGARRNTWSVSVSGNWRMTFQEENGFILNLDLEDYH